MVHRPLLFVLAIATISHNYAAQGFSIGAPIPRFACSFLPASSSDQRLKIHRGAKQSRRHRRLGNNDNVRLHMKLTNDDSKPNNNSLVSAISVGAQPIVWISLATVATTGAGLPPGPLGLLGASEGVSYLIMLALVGKVVYQNIVGDGDRIVATSSNNSSELAERLAIFSLALGLLVLASLVEKQGCVPNAKPILDYSAYVPICDATPGLFGE